MTGSVVLNASAILRVQKSSLDGTPVIIRSFIGSLAITRVSLVRRCWLRKYVGMMRSAVSSGALNPCSIH